MLIIEPVAERELYDNDELYNNYVEQPLLYSNREIIAVIKLRTAIV